MKNLLAWRVTFLMYFTDHTIVEWYIFLIMYVNEKVKHCTIDFQKNIDSAWNLAWGRYHWSPMHLWKWAWFSLIHWNAQCNPSNYLPIPSPPRLALLGYLELISLVTLHQASLWQQVTAVLHAEPRKGQQSAVDTLLMESLRLPYRRIPILLLLL